MRRLVMAIAAAAVVTCAGIVPLPTAAQPTALPPRTGQPNTDHPTAGRLTAGTLLKSGTRTTTGPGIDVISQTPWVKPDGTFLMAVDVDGAPPGARLAVTLHTNAVADRDAFSRTLFGADLGQRAIDLPMVDMSTVGADGEGRQRVNIAVALKQRRAGPAIPGQTSLERGLAGEGAYPVELTLLAGPKRNEKTGSLARVVTHLVRLADRDKDVRPLRAALILGVHAPPSIGPDGADTFDPASVRSIDRLSEVLTEVPDAPLTIDPTPETIEALYRSSDASRRTLAALQSGVNGREVLDGPYVEVPLAAWLDAGLGGEPLDQARARGNRILTERLTPTPDGTTWVARPDLTTEAAARLWELGVRHLVVSPDRVRPHPTDANASGSAPSDTAAAPFQLAGPPAAPITAVALDARLQSAFTRQDDPELTAYQLLAELAVIEQQQPTSTRGVVLATPSDWPVSVPFLVTLLSGMVDGPLVKAVTIDDLFTQVRPLRGGPGGSGAPVVRALDPSPLPDVSAFASQFTSLRRTVASYASMVGPDDPKLAQWDQRLLIAGSSDLTAAQAKAYLDNIQAFISGQVASIDAPSRQTITLTAADGDVPLTLRSQLRQPIDVVLALESGSRLEFPDGDRIAMTLDPGAQRVPLPVRTRSPGDSPLTVRVLSPDGDLLLASTQLTVRSTAVSGIGYVLSGGALLFLVVWWARHWRRAKRDRRSA